MKVGSCIKQLKPTSLLLQPRKQLEDIFIPKEIIIPAVVLKWPRSERHRMSRLLRSGETEGQKGSSILGPQGSFLILCTSYSFEVKIQV